MTKDQMTLDEITERIVPRALDLLKSMYDDRDGSALSKVVDYAAVIALADALRHSIRGTAICDVIMEAATIVSVSLRAGLDEREGKGGGPAA